MIVTAILNYGAMDLSSGTALDFSRTHCSLLSLAIDTTVSKFPYTLQNTFSAMGFSSKINHLLLLDFGPFNHMTSNSSKFSLTSRLQSWSTFTVPVYYEQSIECIPIVPMLFFFLSFFLSRQWSNWELDLSVEHNILLFFSIQPFTSWMLQFPLWAVSIISLQIPILCGFYALEKMASRTSWIIGRTGKHLFLKDHDEGKPPLLLQMINDCGDLKFMWVCIFCKYLFNIQIKDSGWRFQIYTFWHSFLFTGQLCSVLGEELSTQMHALIVSLVRIDISLFDIHLVVA